MGIERYLPAAARRHCPHVGEGICTSTNRWATRNSGTAPPDGVFIHLWRTRDERRVSLIIVKHEAKPGSKLRSDGGAGRQENYAR